MCRSGRTHDTPFASNHNYRSLDKIDCQKARPLYAFFVPPGRRMRPSRSGWSGRRRRQAAQSGRGKGLPLSCNRARNCRPVLSACGPTQTRTTVTWPHWPQRLWSPCGVCWTGSPDNPGTSPFVDTSEFSVVVPPKAELDFLPPSRNASHPGIDLGSSRLKSRAPAAHGRVLQRDGATVHLGKIAHDRQAKTGARRRFVGAHSPFKDYIAHLRDNTRSIIINENDDTAIVSRRLRADSGPGGASVLSGDGC